MEAKRKWMDDMEEKRKESLLPDTTSELDISPK